jgi:hypothetical protein
VALVEDFYRTNLNGMANPMRQQRVLLEAGRRSEPLDEGTPLRGLGDPTELQRFRYRVLIAGIRLGPVLTWDFDWESGTIARAVLATLAKAEVSVAHNHDTFAR